MSWLRFAMALPLAAMLWGCVEQEPDRPREEDKRFIQQNILSQVPQMKFKVNADLEGKVTYLGLDVDRDVIRPGEQFTLTHYWKVIKPLEDWMLFVHLNGPNKQGFLNADHKPIQGRYPVSAWKAGEIIRDVHKVTLPNDWKGTEISVFAGLWKGKQRMKVTGPQDGEGRIVAATLPVSAGGPAPQLKRLVATKTTKPVKLDGVLDDDVWAKAASTRAFVNTLNGSPSPQRTEAKVAWDEKFLYVAFENQDVDVWSLLKARDDKLWTQEADEMFIDADADGKDYIELQVSPAGVIFDSYLPEYRKNQDDWNSGMKVAVKVDGTLNKREDKDQKWTAELAIPWSDVKGRATKALELPPKVGAVWRINFFRMDLPRGQEQQASGWSPPMVGDFHALNKFGELGFGDETGRLTASLVAAAPQAAPAAAAPVPTPAAAAPLPAAPAPTGKLIHLPSAPSRSLRPVELKRAPVTKSAPQPAPSK